MLSGGSLEPVLRDAAPDDYPAVAQLLLTAYDEYRPQVSPELWEGYSRDIANVASRAGTSAQIVAETEGKLVGAVTFYPQPGPMESWPGTHTSIRLLAVHPDARGRGVASMLMAECIGRTQTSGRTHLGLHTTTLMATARAMYLRMGFQRVPAKDMQYGPIAIEAYELNLGISLRERTP